MEQGRERFLPDQDLLAIAEVFALYAEHLKLRLKIKKKEQRR